MVKSNIYPYPLTGTEYYFLSLYNNGLSHKALGVERAGLRIIIWKVSTPDGIESINISNRCDLNNHVHYAKYPGDRKRFLAVFVDDDNANKRNDLFKSHYSRIHCVIPKYDNEIILRKLRKINASELARDQSDCLARTGNGLVIGVVSSRISYTDIEFSLISTENKATVETDRKTYRNTIITDIDTPGLYEYFDCNCLSTCIEYVDCYEMFPADRIPDEFANYVRNKYYTNGIKDPFISDPKEFYSLVDMGIPFNFIKKFNPGEHVFEVQGIFVDEDDPNKIARPLFVSSEII